MRQIIILSGNELDLNELYLPEYEGAETICISEVENVDLSKYDHFLVEWKSRYDFVKKYGNIPVGKKVVFTKSGYVIDIDDKETIYNIEKKAKESNDWNLCKSINELKMLANVIRKQVLLDSVPMKLQIETTDICNARCIMCSHAYSTGTGKNILSAGIVERIKDILPFVQTVILHGNGEPFIFSAIIKYIDYMANYGVSFITNTNLSILNEDIVNRIKKHFVEINVSCDGHSKELYESIRVGLNYDKFIENAKLLRKSCPNLMMKMTTVVMRQNIPYLKEIVKLAHNLGFNEIMFNQLCVDGKNNNLKDDPRLYLEQLQIQTNEAIDEGKKRGIKVISSYNVTKPESRCSHSKMKFSGICDWLLECPYIDLSGNVAICCMQQKIILGNLFDEPFKDVWNNSLYKKFRNDFYVMNLPKVCRGCDFVLQDKLKFLELQELSEEYRTKIGR